MADFQSRHSGIPGLDELLNGGYITGRMYLVRGRPGTGKSMLGMHFLEAGLDNDEPVVYIHGEEAKQEIIANADAIGIDLRDATFLDLGPDTDFFTEDISYELVEPTEIEDQRHTDDIRNIIEELNPRRVFIDPITQLRHVEPDQYQYRKRLLAFMRFLRDQDTTVLTSKTPTDTGIGEEIESLSDGLIELNQDTNDRRISIPKHRGRGQQDGSHGYEIRDQGIEVYPQLQPSRGSHPFTPDLLSSGQAELDALLGGGIEQGSVTFVSGPTGVGKTTTGTQFVEAAAHRGEAALIYLFEETVDEFMFRTRNFGYSMDDLQSDGSVLIRAIEPMAQSAEEVSQQIKADLADVDPTLFMLDGIDGFKTSLGGDEQRLVERLHALTRYLKQEDVAVLVMDEMENIRGIPSATSTNTSYIADTVVILSYLETSDGLDRTIGVLKKRYGDFENQFRWFELTADGLHVADPLDDFRGVPDGQILNPTVEDQSPQDTK